MYWGKVKKVPVSGLYNNRCFPEIEGMHTIGVILKYSSGQLVMRATMQKIMTIVFNSLRIGRIIYFIVWNWVESGQWSMCWEGIAFIYHQKLDMWFMKRNKSHLTCCLLSTAKNDSLLSARICTNFDCYTFHDLQNAAGMFPIMHFILLNDGKVKWDNRISKNGLKTHRLKKMLFWNVSGKPNCWR